MNDASNWFREENDSRFSFPCGCAVERRFRCFRGKDLREWRRVFCPDHAAKQPVGSLTQEAK